MLHTRKLSSVSPFVVLVYAHQPSSYIEIVVVSVRDAGSIKLTPSETTSSRRNDGIALEAPRRRLTLLAKG